MRLEQLEYLCEIAKRKSMNQAAAKLFVSQQTLSTAIKTLEKELDTKLLERTYHGVFPTQIGQELINISKNLISDLDQLKLKIAAQNNRQLEGTLRIASEPGIADLIWPNLTVSFYKYFPDVMLELQQMERINLREVILSGDCDVALFSYHADENTEPPTMDGDIIPMEFAEFHLMARVSRHSPLANENELSLRTLLTYPIALNNNNSGIDLQNELRKYGEPTILPTNHFGVSQQLVLENLAISLSVKLNNFSPHFFNSFDGGIVNIPIKESIPFYAYYAVRESMLENPLVTRFIDTLTKLV